MAPMASSSHYGAEENVPIEEIVFSCSICQATVSDVYLSSESNKGFYSGSGDGDGIVTKMWIAECSHVTCAKHLDGGGKDPSTHSQHSELTCFLSPKLYHFIRRTLSLEHRVQGASSQAVTIYQRRYMVSGACLRARLIQQFRWSGDDARPSRSTILCLEWRLCDFSTWVSRQYTPSTVLSADLGTALCHYGRRARKHCQDASNKQRALETAYSKERKERRQLQTELLALENQVGLLKEAEAELHKWQDKKPEILHCLGAFGEMSRYVPLHSLRMTLA